MPQGQRTPTPPSPELVASIEQVLHQPVDLSDPTQRRQLAHDVAAATKAWQAARARRWRYAREGVESQRSPKAAAMF